PGLPDTLKNIELSIKEGEFLILVGPSGCGKSTTLRMIAGLETASAGQVLIGGRDVTQLPPAQRGIAMVFQNYALFPHLSVAENIGFGLAVRKVPKAEAAQRLKDTAELLGLAQLLDRKPGQLSGGQQQRVALARALCLAPQILLFDEPTSALDPEMVHEVLDVMVELAGQGITMVCVTHEMEFARSVADRVVFMDQGQIIEQAQPDAFFSNPQSERAQQFLDKLLGRK
ncbi:MAG: amino acid ABC transporter ATP-binding protein, partial [Comamonas sp.]